MISDKCEEKVLKLGNIRMPYWVYGDIRRPAIFYLHGFAKPFSENSGDLPVRYLMEQYCVLAFDLPGWGRSKRVQNSTKEIIDIISKEMNINKFFLLGTSYGGALSLLYASSKPQKLNGVIAAGVPRFGMRSIATFLAFTKFFSITKAHALYDLFFLTKHLPTIKVPVLLLYSKTDQVATSSNGSFYTKKIEQSKLVLINERNHNWLLHRIIDNKFGAEIELFLKTYS